MIRLVMKQIQWSPDQGAYGNNNFLKPKPWPVGFPGVLQDDRTAWLLG
jgi:hypothetical protein